MENAIDSRIRIKSTTYSDIQQKPYQFFWQRLLHITVAPKGKTLLKFGSVSHKTNRKVSVGYDYKIKPWGLSREGKFANLERAFWLGLNEIALIGSGVMSAHVRDIKYELGNAVTGHEH